MQEAQRSFKNVEKPLKERETLLYSWLHHLELSDGSCSQSFALFVTKTIEMRLRKNSVLEFENVLMYGSKCVTQRKHKEWFSQLKALFMWKNSQFVSFTLFYLVWVYLFIYSNCLAIIKTHFQCFQQRNASYKTHNLLDFCALTLPVTNASSLSIE